MFTGGTGSQQYRIADLSMHDVAPASDRARRIVYAATRCAMRTSIEERSRET